MARAKVDNRVKRKRGKKFVYRDGSQPGKDEDPEDMANPFEDHSKSKRARKDAEVRQGLVAEFKERGRNSQFVDNRIAEKNSKFSEEDKMKLRFMKEQKEQLKKEISHSHLNKKRKKFQLGEDSDEADNFDFLTHGGKKLEELDDFKDKINESDDDLYEDKDMKKGVMTEEMVKMLNFGGGDMDQEGGEVKKKSREERLEEIMKKSKAFKMYEQEVKAANLEYTRQLDDEWGDVAKLLNYKQKDIDTKTPVDTKNKDFDDLYTRLKTEGGIKKIQPELMNLTEKQKAQKRREKLMSLAASNADGVDL
jgi:hypothetical protein